MANSADPDQIASSGMKFQKPTDLDLHCLQKQDISRFSRTRVNCRQFWSYNDLFSQRKKRLIPYICIYHNYMDCRTCVDPDQDLHCLLLIQQFFDTETGVKWTFTWLQIRLRKRDN